MSVTAITATNIAGTLIKIKFCKTLVHILIAEPYHFILFQYVFLGSDILTTHTVIFLLVLVVKHVDVQISHKTGGTSEI